MEHASDLEVLERLKQAAKADSDKSLATLLGLSRQSVAKARATKSVPSSWIPIAAKLFNVSTDWLFFGSDSMRHGEQARPAVNATEQPVSMLETVSCAQCAKLEAELEEERKERRELAQENRQLLRENGDLKARCATLEERQKTCCPDPLLQQPPPSALSSEARAKV